MIKQSFLPIIAQEPRILILGSLPGDLSLEMNQYYGHPRNRFWKIMFTMFDEEFSNDYQIREKLIQNNHLALWDVAYSATRKGSMDVDMKDVIPNKIEEMLQKNRSIRQIIFNGKKAEQLFKRCFEQKSTIIYTSLPSTSPANAQFSTDRLIEIWRNSLILH